VQAGKNEIFTAEFYHQHLQQSGGGRQGLLCDHVSDGICFALAMSVDGFFGGLGAAFLDISIAGTVCLNLVFSALAVLGGSAVGKYAADRCKRDYSWIGGALFVVLAFSKIL